MRITLLLILCATFCSSGCAALSLFGSTHTHTHNHECDLDASDQRFSRLERRIGELEQKQGDTSIWPEETLKPVESSPTLSDRAWSPSVRFGTVDSESGN